MMISKFAFAYIPSPPVNGFSIGPLFFHFYGIMYVLAVTAAILLGRARWQSRGGNAEVIYEAARWGFPAGLVGGRIYFDITTPSQMPHTWWGPFAIWTGGLGIWGGVLAGVLVAAWRLRRHLSWAQIRLLMDVAAPALLVAQGIGRIGNYFNQELFGAPSSLPWAVKIAPQFRPPGYHRYATFQPSFLYELIFDFAWAVFLIVLGNRRRIKAPGLFALYVAGYTCYRMFEETIRIDYSQYILGMRLNFWVALIGALVSLSWFAWIQWRSKWEEAPDAASALPAGSSTAAYSRSAQV